MDGHPGDNRADLVAELQGDYIGGLVGRHLDRQPGELADETLDERPIGHQYESYDERIEELLI